MSASVTSLPDFRDGSDAQSKRQGSLEQMQETPIDEGDTAGAYFSIFMYYVQVYIEQMSHFAAKGLFTPSQSGTKSEKDQKSTTNFKVNFRCRLHFRLV